MRCDADVAVIGAGPAGLSAATAAAAAGAHVVVLDEQSGPGGQVYRAVETVEQSRPADISFLGKEYRRGIAVAREFRAVACDYRPGTSVWHVGERVAGRRRDVFCSANGKAFRVRARHVVIATGALERPVPIPGWTVPGVMSVGAVQSALKSSAVCPAGRLVIAGSGPLPVLVAAQLLAARAPVAALVDTTPPGALTRALAYLPGALAAGMYLHRGMMLWRAVRRAGIPVYRAAAGLRVIGSDRVSGLAFHAGGREHSLEADVIALHEGLVPNSQLTRLVGMRHRWDRRQRSWRPVLGPWGESSEDGIHVAGDGGGIAGARAAEFGGRALGLDLAWRLGLISEPERDLAANEVRFRRTLDLGIRPFLDRYFPPPDWIGRVPDGVTVCRCEEVTAGQVRELVAQGCSGPNQMKAFLRCGMGPCQGRLCAPTVEEVMAVAGDRAVAEVGTYRIRPPVKPVTLAEMASLGDG